MKLRYLYHFLAVAEELNFTRAAAKVHTEPSPLSRTIRDLESELQVHLFQRHLRHLRLTMAGEVFRSEVRRLLACLDDACAKARAVEQGYLGQLRIGLANPLAQPQLARLLARCREEEPRTRIRILEMTDEGMTNALNFNQIDAYFTVNPESVRELRKEIAWWDRFAVAIPRNHPLIALSQIPLHEIAKFPLLLFHRTTAFLHQGHPLLSIMI